MRPPKRTPELEKAIRDYLTIRGTSLIMASEKFHVTEKTLRRWGIKAENRRVVSPFGTIKGARDAREFDIPARMRDEFHRFNAMLMLGNVPEDSRPPMTPMQQEDHNAVMRKKLHEFWNAWKGAVDADPLADPRAMRPLTGMEAVGWDKVIDLLGYFLDERTISQAAYDEACSASRRIGGLTYPERYRFKSAPVPPVRPTLSPALVPLKPVEPVQPGPPSQAVIDALTEAERRETAPPATARRLCLGCISRGYCYREKLGQVCPSIASD